MRLEVGQQALFLGYAPDNKPEEVILFFLQRVVVAEVGNMDSYKVFPVDQKGRVFSVQGETVFEGELVALDVRPVPIKHLPQPFGEGSVDYAPH